MRTRLWVVAPMRATARVFGLARPAPAGSGMSRKVWTSARFVGAALVLGVLVWRLGASPFLAGLRTVDGGVLAAAAGIVLLTTTCCAWRWKLVAGALGVELSLSAAVAGYYRALFLNVTLPGGVVGDVHRGVSHGRDVGDVGRALRSVAWERFAGQVVQVLLTLAVLLAFPSPVRPFMPYVTIAVLAAVAGVLLVARVRPGGARSAWTRLWSAVAADIRIGLLPRRAWPGIAAVSALSVAGHAAAFLLAARTAGVSASAARMLPLALLVMAAMVLPNIGGWGPREGVTAWAFGAAGLGAARGVSAAVVFGVMVFAASLPGAAVLVVEWFRRTHSSADNATAPAERPARA